MNVLVVGGGNSAHVLIPLLDTFGDCEISLLTRKPEQWSCEITAEYLDQSGKLLESYSGRLKKVSSNPEELVPTADVIVLCMPVSNYRQALQGIAEFISPGKKTIVGTIYGQGGFNWMVDSVKREYGLSLLEYFAIGLIPWVCRQNQYGVSGITYGPKARNVIAHSHGLDYGYLKREFLDPISLIAFGTGEFFVSANFLSLTLSVDNQVIHTSRLYAMFKESGLKWSDKEKVPLFYKDYDDMSAMYLSKLDAELSRIRDKLNDGESYQYMLDYLDLERFSYDSCNENIKESFIESTTLGLIKTPVIKSQDSWIVSPDHRFFTDDIYFGLCIMKWFAQHLNLLVPFVDELLKWAGDYTGTNLLDENCELNSEELIRKLGLGYGGVESYGIASLDDALG